MAGGAKRADTLDGVVEYRMLRRHSEAFIDQRFDKIDDWKPVYASFPDDCVGDGYCDLHGLEFSCPVHRRAEAPEQGKYENGAAPIAWRAPSSTVLRVRFRWGLTPSACSCPAGTIG